MLWSTNISAEQFTRTIQENGGNYNAFTSKDFIAYFETLSSDRVDIYALDVVATLLSEGKSSRLHKRLVLQEQLALSADAQNSLLSVDPSLFYVSAEPLPGKHLKKVESVIDEELEKLKKEPVDRLELEKAKNQLEASFLFAQDSLFYQAMLLARYEIVGGWQEIDRYIPAIRKVTPEDIKRVAEKYLVKENRTTGTLVPLPINEDKAASQSTPIKDTLIK